MTFRKLIAAKFMTLVLSFTVLHPEFAQEHPGTNTNWVQYAPSKTTLDGKIIVETKLGPPGYGDDPKHDRRVKVYVLRLVAPVNVRGSGEYQTQRNVGEIEIFFRKDSGPDSWQSAHSAIGKPVRVAGELRQSMMGFEYTPVVMDVDELSVLDRKAS